jgi:hypothetical protein
MKISLIVLSFVTLCCFKQSTFASFLEEEEQHLLSLPLDTLIYAVSLLDSKSFINCKISCKSFHKICNKDTLLLTEDEEKLKLLLLNSFKDALDLIGRNSPNKIANVLRILAENQNKKNNHYLFSNINIRQQSNRSWDICYKALYLAAQVGDNKAKVLLQEECERKKRRLESYKSYLKDDDHDEIVHLFCWEQVAYFDKEARTPLITYIQTGVHKDLNNEERAKAWLTFDWESNHFVSYFKKF